MKKIVVDIYGADEGIESVVCGVAKALKSGMDFFPVMVGEKVKIDELMGKSGVSSDSYEVINTTEFITNDDPPTCVFGDRENSSLVMAYNRLKNDPECIAMLSPGSTGALLVGSICRLGLVGGMKFPALISALPCAGEKLVCLVDCGANIDCTSSDLVRFAKMGSVFSTCHCGIENPRVGLLSVGREDSKGNALTREAFQKIKELPINFIGNVEGSDLVSGYADVIVSDGFAGNVILKCAEASGKAAAQIAEKIGNDIDKGLAEKIKEAILYSFDFNSRGGATFLGPKKTVVKMHGSANENTAVACIDQILRLEKSNFSQEIAKVMAK